MSPSAERMPLQGMDCRLSSLLCRASDSVVASYLVNSTLADRLSPLIEPPEFLEYDCRNE